MNKFIRPIIYILSIISFLVLFFILSYILVKGFPHLSLDLFSLEYNTSNLSLLPALVNTLLLILISLAISLPIGIFSAIYLVEYADESSHFIKLLRLTTESLAAIPSIVYGLFGMLFFVNQLKLGFSLISGSLTMSIMVLPLIIRTSEEALITVDNSLREASYALGASKLDTIFKVVLPKSLTGIFSGIILAMGRIVGESAALIYTAGTVAQLPESIFSSTRTLSVHIYSLISEGLNREKAFASALVLMLVVLIINFFSEKLARKIN